MLEIGTLVDGKYKILSKVGQGGMSVVYLAINEKANAQWAVKEVRKDGVKDFEVVKQGLVAETDILKKLSHPSLPRIIDVIDSDESIIIIMDYIQGNSLNVALDEYGAQPQENVIEWAKQLADVLGYLHSRTPPIIYRDMKPANVMLKPDGNVTLIDFGTAREFKEKNLADTTCLGTVGYAAPEQFGGMGQTDARTDIYCLGATLYHLVTGKNPCEPPYEIKPIREINPSLSVGFEKVILKCTQRDPNDRYQSAAELMYALEHYKDDDLEVRKKQKKKLKTFFASATLTLIFALVSVFGYTSAEKQKSANYEYVLAGATSVEDYYQAILTDPTRVDAYIGSNDFRGLTDYLIADGELTSDESLTLMKLKGGLDSKDGRGYITTTDVLSQLKAADSTAYQDVCYEVGEAYLFYYDIAVEKDKYSNASMWFQYAKQKYPVAGLYCDISDCLENISKYSKAEQYAKLYEEYTSLWSKIMNLRETAEKHDDDLKLRVWNEIVNMIRNNAKEFSEVATQEKLLNVLDTIEQDSIGIKNTFLQENIARLRENVKMTRTKVHSIKS